VELLEQPRSHYELSDGVKLAYVEMGQGTPLVLIHGWSSSINWWRYNVEALARDFRVIAVDLRGHGDSEKVPTGHTIEQYARDVRELVAGLGAEDGLMVGWSMGCMVLWNYVMQFGRDQARAMIFVGQSARDLKTPEFDLALMTHDDLHEWMLAVQTDRPAFLAQLMHDTCKHVPSEAFLNWMSEDYQRCPPHIAAVALYHQTTVDSLPAFPLIDFPTQVHFGTDPKMYELAQGEYLAREIPGTELVVFEESGHVPMIEEPEKFNETVKAFARQVFDEAPV
jgi:pimeloyl-ACP methyl ester carboxylesterase